MAKAITKIQHIELSEEQRRRKDLEEVETALLDNKDAILQSLDVIKHMHDRGVLSLLGGLFSEGDKVHVDLRGGQLVFEREEMLEKAA